MKKHVSNLKVARSSPAGNFAGRFERDLDVVHNLLAGGGIDQQIDGNHLTGLKRLRRKFRNSQAPELGRMVFLGQLVGPQAESLKPQYCRQGSRHAVD